ncbi:MAG: hypothetical protein HY042_03850, partial [Spirochaetia bacterium]|nr:hypothetical protein [Spirochaetia bacterium]
IPTILGVIATIAAALLYRFAFTRLPGVDESSWGPGFVAEAMSVLTVGIAVFVIAGIVQEYAQGIRSRRIRFNENVLIASVRMILRNKRRYAGYLVHLSVVFLFVGYAGGSFKKTAHFDFLYYKMAPTGEGKEIHYHSSDKAYLENYEIAAQDLFIRPVFGANADPTNPIQMTISQEAHYYVRRGPKDKQPSPAPANLTPYAAANRPFPPQERLLRLTTGFVMDGRMKTERHFHPQTDPSTGQLAKTEDGGTMRIPTSKPDIRSTWSEDFYIQLGGISDPLAKNNPDMNRRFEFYYYDMERDPAAYARFFPGMITATLEVWINPMTKFIWLGSLLFFLSGLIILIPYGERDLE